MNCTTFTANDTYIDSSLKTKEWLTTNQAAEYLNIPIGSLRNLTSNGKVPYHKLGNLNRYHLLELRNLLFRQQKGASNGY